MDQTKRFDVQKELLRRAIRTGLLRELLHREQITQGQFERLMGLRRGRQDD